MKYLKPEIFYYEIVHSIRPYTCNVNDLSAMNRAREQYEDYFNSIKNSLPKKLVALYSEGYSGFPNNRFHDCLIKELSIVGDSQVYNNKNDYIHLVLTLGREFEYRMRFFGIRTVKFSGRSEIALSKKEFLGEALLCELGITDANTYTFELFSSTATEIYIEFTRINIDKLRII